MEVTDPVPTVRVFAGPSATDAGGRMIAASGSASGFLLWLSDAGVGEEVIIWDAGARFGITGGVCDQRLRPSFGRQDPEFHPPQPIRERNP